MSVMHSDAAVFSGSINHEQRDGREARAAFLNAHKCVPLIVILSLIFQFPWFHASTKHYARAIYSRVLYKYRIPDNKIFIHLMRIPN